MLCCWMERCETLCCWMEHWDVMLLDGTLGCYFGDIMLFDGTLGHYVVGCFTPWNVMLLDVMFLGGPRREAGDV